MRTSGGKLSLGLLSGLAWIAFIATDANATTGVTTITTSNVTLTADHYGQIVFGAGSDGKVLDCNGFNVIFSAIHTPATWRFAPQPSSTCGT